MVRARFPDIDSALTTLSVNGLVRGDRFAQMSGSGSTVFFMPGELDAERSFDALVPSGQSGSVINTETAAHVVEVELSG